LEYLNSPVHLKFFAEENLPSTDDILLVFKIYFKLLNIKNTKVFDSNNHLRLEIHKYFTTGEQNIGITNNLITKLRKYNTKICIKL